MPYAKTSKSFPNDCVSLLVVLFGRRLVEDALEKLPLLLVNLLFKPLPCFLDEYLVKGVLHPLEQVEHMLQLQVRVVPDPLYALQNLEAPHVLLNAPPWGPPCLLQEPHSRS